MSNKVQHKRSSVAGKIPAATDLEIGELALNFADKKLYTRDGAGTVISISEPAIVPNPAAGVNQAIQPADVADVPLTIQGKAGQTGALQQWSDGTGKVLSALGTDGSLTVGDQAWTAGKLTGQFSAGSVGGQRDNVCSAWMSWDATKPTLPGLVINNPAERTGPALHLVKGFGFSGRLIDCVDPAGSKFTIDNDFNTTIEVTDPTAVPLVLKGAAGQTAPLLTCGSGSNYPLIVSPDKVVFSATQAYVQFNSSSQRAVLDISTTRDPNRMGILIRSDKTKAPQVNAYLRVSDGTTTLWQVNSVGTAQQLSDGDMKKRQEPITDAMDAVQNLTGKTFRWKGNDKLDAGLIAQEVHAALGPHYASLPEYNDEGEKTMAGSVSYNAIVGLLVEALKDANQRITQLEEQINAG